MTTIIEVLSRLGTLDWYAVRPADLFSGKPACLRIPIVTFRFCGGNDILFSKISDYLSEADVQDNWRLVGEGEKNATFAPHVICKDNGTASFQLADEISRESPDAVKDLTNEFLEIVDKLANVIQEFTT